MGGKSLMTWLTKDTLAEGDGLQGRSLTSLSSHSDLTSDISRKSNQQD